MKTMLTGVALAAALALVTPAHAFAQRGGGHSRGSGGSQGTATPRGGAGGGSQSGGGTTRGGGDSRSGGPSRGGDNGHVGTAVPRPGGSLYSRPYSYYSGYRPYRYWPYYYGGALGLGLYYYDPYWYSAYGYGQYGYGGSYYPGYADPGYAYEATGGLRLEVEPRNAEVWIDGAYRGIVDDVDGRISHLELTVGPHRVDVRAPGFRTLSFSVNIQRGRTTDYKGALIPVR